MRSFDSSLQIKKMAAKMSCCQQINDSENTNSMKKITAVEDRKRVKNFSCVALNPTPPPPFLTFRAVCKQASDSSEQTSCTT